MVRNIVVIGGSSHPDLTHRICAQLGLPPANVLLDKFANGETRVEIKESVRGKDVYIIQSGCGQVNDNFIELCIAISACQTASAKKVTAVLPLFPYSRQSDIPYNKTGAPLRKSSNVYSKPDFLQGPQPQPHQAATLPNGTAEHESGGGLPNGVPNGVDGLHKTVMKVQLDDSTRSSTYGAYVSGQRHRSDTLDSSKSSANNNPATHNQPSEPPARPDDGRSAGNSTSAPMTRNPSKDSSGPPPVIFQPQPGYKQWVAQAGTLVANLLTCAGANHVITMDLHDPQYQGFFDIPVDNLYGRPLIKKYIQQQIPDFRNAVMVSPDAGGAKRASTIADSLGLPFALIHKERRPTKITDRQNATMMLVGDVEGRTAILVDDLADTSNTITRAAKLLKKEGATRVYALITHGILSGDAIERINNSYLDKLVVTNTVPQKEHARACPKLEVLDVGPVFAEAIRRVHHGESISTLFQYD